MIAALAVSASLAVSVVTPAAERKEPVAEASRIVAHQQHYVTDKYGYAFAAGGGPSPSHYGGQPLTAQVGPSQVGQSQTGSSSSIGLAGYGVAGLLDVMRLPKKYLGIASSVVVGALKSLDAKKLLKAVLLVALVTVLGAVAAVAVAGLVSLVTGLCAIAPYLKFFMGSDTGELSDSHLDSIGNFVLGAFNKYEMQHKA